MFDTDEGIDDATQDTRFGTLKAIESMEGLTSILQREQEFPFNGIVLATTEDDQYAYFRSFWRELNESTGDNIRLFVLVEPSAGPHRPHRGMMDMLMLTNLPRGPASAYGIASKLGVGRGSLPCIAVFVGRPHGRQNMVIVKLPPYGDLRRFLRQLFDIMDDLAGLEASKRLAGLERKLETGKAWSILKAPLADILQKGLGSRTAGLLDAGPHR